VAARAKKLSSNTIRSLYEALGERAATACSVVSPRREIGCVTRCHTSPCIRVLLLGMGGLYTKQISMLLNALRAGSADWRIECFGRVAGRGVAAGGAVLLVRLENGHHRRHAIL